MSDHGEKIEAQADTVALYTDWHKFAHINSAVKTSPAISAGLTDRV